MKVYKILKAGNLMMLRAYIKGPEGKAYPKLLVDTGSAYTIISHEFLEMIGCSPALCKKRSDMGLGADFESCKFSGIM